MDIYGIHSINVNIYDKVAQNSNVVVVLNDRIVVLFKDFFF